MRNCYLCKIKISKSSKSGKCVSCVKIGNKNNYKHGKTHNNKCKDCGKKIWLMSCRCKRCARKVCKRPNFNATKEKNGFYGKKHSLKTREEQSLSHGGTGIPYENSDYTIEFDKNLKKIIKQRDDYTCQNCNITEEEFIIVFGEVLSIHHIDYDKTNNNKNNLITVCRHCNSRANFNRDYWINYYLNILTSIKSCL